MQVLMDEAAFPLHSESPLSLGDACNCTDNDTLKRCLVDAASYQSGIFWLQIGIAVLFLCATIMSAFLAGAKVKPRPPRYWKMRPKNPFHDSYAAEIDVTEELRDPIQRLLEFSTKRESMGMGRDGHWATHKGFRVRKVTRIENGKLWSQYARARIAVEPLEKKLQRLEPQWRVYGENTLKVTGDVHDKRVKDGVINNFVRSLSLDSRRNERLLFHGCPGASARDAVTGEVLYPSEECSPLHAIKNAGFDERLGNLKGMFGSGTYFADMSSKADQYAGRYGPPHAGSVGEVATMFIARVTLGLPYLTKQSLEQLRRPPCIQGHFDLNLFWNENVQFGKPWKEKGVPFQICEHPRFDSVIGDFSIDELPKQYREFVVYARQSYPEFCVTYERIA